MTNTYKNAFTEVWTILEYLDDKSYFKIPEDVLNTINKNQNTEYEFFLDESIPLLEQNLLKETKAILFTIYRDYLTDEKSKNMILNYQKKKIENAKREKYNPDNLFKERNGSDKITNNKVGIVVKQEGIIKRIINKIINFIKKW